MTAEIREEIKKINPSRHGQHDRIKKSLEMVCDMLDMLANPPMLIDASKIPEQDVKEMKHGPFVKTPRLEELKKKIEGDKNEPLG